MPYNTQYGAKATTIAWVIGILVVLAILCAIH